MLTVIQQIISYVTMEVLEPNWRNLEAKIGKVTTVDQLLRDHVDFLDTCLKECMLTNAKILKACLNLFKGFRNSFDLLPQIHSKLFLTCLTFSQYSGQFTKQASQAIEKYEQTGEADPEELHTSMEKRWSFLAKFEQNFNHHEKVRLATTYLSLSHCLTIVVVSLQMYHGQVQYLATSETTSLLALVVRLNVARAG
jgi:gamma-tubulin complex component 2